MARSRFLRRRSPTEWGVRFTFAGAVGWIGYLSVIQSLAVALPDSQIERAYSLAPNNGQVAAHFSEWLSGPEAPPKDRARSVKVAKEALRHDPTAVEAVATLAVDALIHGDQASAKRLFTYSQFLSRRDLRTQLWAIEDAVKQGDIAGALKHYDIALRTKKNAPELLYPVLASAVSDSAIRREVGRTLARQPAWSSSFVDYVATNSSDPQATAALFLNLRRARFPVPESASNALIDALVTAEKFRDAWSYYSTIRPGTERRVSRDPSFAAMIENPSQFDWVPMNEPGTSTAIQSGPKGGIFDFAATPSVGGVLLQQLQMLPEGEYVLQGRSASIEQPLESRPFWALSCRGGRELGRLDVPNSSETNGRFTGRFTVPASCPVQVLTLVARPSNEITGVKGQIDQVLLRPAFVGPNGVARQQ